MANHNNEEIKNKRRSARTTFIVHSMVLLVAFFFGCPVNKAVDPNYQIAVTFEPQEISFEKASNSAKAEAKAGEERKKSEPVKKVKKRVIKDIETKPTKKIEIPEPTPTPPSPTEPIISETTIEDEVEVEAVEEDIDFETPELEEVPEDPAPPVEEVAEEKTEADSGGSPSGSDDPDGSTSPANSGDGSGSGKGDAGDGKGSDGSGDDDDSGIGTGGPGSGDFDDSGNGVFGRRVIYRNTTEVLAVGFENQEGKVISAKFCVNRAGKITYAEIMDDETNAIIPFGKIKDVLRGIYGYRVEADLKAPREECGMLTIRIKEISALHGG